jgi:hypothetical protein
MCQVLEQCSIRAITKLNLRDTDMVVDHTSNTNNKGRPSPIIISRALKVRTY